MYNVFANLIIIVQFIKLKYKQFLDKFVLPQINN